MAPDRRFDAAFVRTCTSEDDLAALAADIAVTLRCGDVVALAGPVGSGKTAFARALVRALHGIDEGTSPTFTLRHRYDGDPPIEHLDFYRIEGEAGAAELGLDEAFSGDAIVIVEWWRNAPSLLPRLRWEIDIDGCGEAPRTIRLARPPA